MSNEKGHDHGQIREDFPGGWASDEKNAFTGEGLSAEKKEAQAFVKKLLNWRKNNPVIHDGKLMQYAPQGNGIYIYFRYNDDESVMVIFNKNEEQTLINSDYYHERLDGYESGRDVITGENYSLQNLQVPARSAMILELK